MVIAEPEHVSSYQNEQPREQRHPAEMAKNRRVYTKQCKDCVEQITQCSYHWYKLQHNKQKLMTTFS